MLTTHDLIRHVDDVELPVPGWWPIPARQPVDLRTTGWRRRMLTATVAGGMTMADRPLESTLDLLVSVSDGTHDDLVLRADLVTAHLAGTWRLAGTVTGAVTAPVTVDVRYHGVYRHGGRATAWLAVRARLPRAGRRGGLVLRGDLHADHPASAL